MMGSPFGRFLVGLVALATATFPFFFWFDAHHLADPAWPPHARAHLLFFMAFVMLANGIALTLTVAYWERTQDVRLLATATPCLVWVAKLIEVACLSPAMGVTVSFTHWHQRLFGEAEANLFGVLAPLAVAILGYLLDRQARLRGLHTKQSPAS
jgi:hypothetical protein